MQEGSCGIVTDSKIRNMAPIFVKDKIFETSFVNTVNAETSNLKKKIWSKMF